ncbi:MAG TPA: hypothetical protein PKY29_02440 [Ferruginibacter sp.]|nr:hypothetical protein [Ferruginibacter sp.]HRO18361.1 hypothetical protein [Ferruginibacter sp.]HRQ20140.1 hypothetical protein [Ferruginibacter sp.]
MKSGIINFFKSGILATVLFTTFTACSDDDNDPPPPGSTSSPAILVIDEESIDNGNPPNNFSNTDVNDQLATVGLRQPLQYFASNIGDTIILYTGDVGDEGWHALKTIPDAWKVAGPTTNGTDNFLMAGPGLGSGPNPEILLDDIPNVTPLRATGLKMLTGKTILAVVYDGDISTNYSPLTGNLMGANLGIVGLTVLGVTARTDGSSQSLPKVKVKIEDASLLAMRDFYLFSNAPVPVSSSVPDDVNPPVTVPEPVFVAAP